MKRMLTILLVILFHGKAYCTITALSITNCLCNQSCNGAITVTSSGGIAPYNYDIIPAIGTQNSPGVFSNLCAGVYTITSTDAANTTQSASFVVTQPTMIGSYITPGISPSCTPGCDGTAAITGTGGTSPFNYSISPSTAIITLNSISGLCAGVVYTITATDMNGCSNTTLTLPISAINSLNVTLNSTTSACPPACSGTVTTNIAGGVSPYTYSILPGGVATNGLFTGLCGNTSYTVVVADGNGCIGTASTTVGYSVLSNVSVNSVVFDASCNLATDGAIQVTTNPSSGFNYHWSNGDTTEDISNVTNGIYTLTITDTSGACMDFTDTIDVLGANCGTITGYVIWDSAGNCMNNPGDLPIPNQLIELSTGDLAITDPSGYFQFSNVPFGTHTITQMPSGNIFPNVCTQPSAVVLNASNSLSNNHVFMDSTSYQLDETLYMYGTRYIPGFTPTNSGAFIQLYIYNPSPFYLQNKLTLLLNDSLQFHSSTLTPLSVVSTPNGDSITWLVNTAPFQGGYSNGIIVFVDVPVNLSLGSWLTSCAEVTPINFTDVNITDNHQCVTKQVATSFDPNNKSVQPEGIGSSGYITLQDSVLNYTIQFQNTGTAPAQNIYILDTLSNKLDVQSLEIIGYSHPYQIEIISGHILKFKFINILLADSNQNEPASHGYISYRIKQKINNMPGDAIPNTASIYFDFNSPVVTNTTVNTIMNPTESQWIHSAENNLHVYPNPSRDFIKVHYQSSGKNKCPEWNLYNAVGTIIEKGRLDNSGKSYDGVMNVSKLAKGIYYVKVEYSILKILVE